MKAMTKSWLVEKGVNISRKLDGTNQSNYALMASMDKSAIVGFAFSALKPSLANKI